MKRKYGDFLIKLAFVTAALFLVFDFGVLSGLLGKIFTVCRPVFLGVVTYMVLSVPYDLFYGKVFCRIKREKPKKALSVIVSILLFLGAITLLGALTIPQSIESAKEIIDMFSGENQWNKIAQSNRLMAFLVEAGQKAYALVATRFTEYMPTVLTFFKDVVTGVYNLVFGLFIGVMLLIGRDSIKRQFKSTLLLILSEEKCLAVLSFLRKTISKFSKYLGGQVTEAFILGTVCYLVMLLLRVPYPALIGFVIGFANLIPIVGAYIGGFVCGVLVFAVSPVKCLVFTVAVVVLQQIEAFTTYPAIVGKYVGLSSFWIAVSVLVWGGLFGLWGLFLGVPVTAVIQDLLREKSLLKKKISKSI